METIFATSSGRPPAAIAIVRISGPEAFAAAAILVGQLPRPRRATLRALRDRQGRLIDRVLVLVFPSPTSATGEDIVELHCHGGRAVVAAVENTLAGLAHLRPALAGEFTRRALTNGRIDLAEAEGLADLITAETEAQRIAALDAAEGRVSRAVGLWAARLADLSAQVEASLDWSDEGDVASAMSIVGVADAIAALRTEIAEVMAAAPVERIKEGLRVVLAGPPNAGKSTLFNALAERAVSIVSPVAGTTRDVIEATVTRRGIAYILTDTAGLRSSTTDPVEAEGITRAEGAVKKGDLVIWLGDDAPPQAKDIWVYPRTDLAGRSSIPETAELGVSAVDDKSVGQLWALIEQRASALLPRVGALPLLARHRALCAHVVSELSYDGVDPLIVAEHLRLARGTLAQITGAQATETMLDALFMRFCVGK